MFDTRKCRSRGTLARGGHPQSVHLYRPGERGPPLKEETRLDVLLVLLNDPPSAAAEVEWDTLFSEMMHSVSWATVFFIILPSGMETSRPKNCQSSGRITWQIKSFGIHTFIFFYLFFFCKHHLYFYSCLGPLCLTAAYQWSSRVINHAGIELLLDFLFFFFNWKISERVIWRHLLSRCYWFYTQHHLLSPTESLDIKLIDCFIFYSSPTPLL